MTLDFTTMSEPSYMLQLAEDRAHWPGEYRRNPTKAKEAFRTNDEMERSIQLLRDGESKLEYPSDKEAALLFSPVGCDKSELALFLSGNGNDLFVTQASQTAFITDRSGRIKPGNIVPTLYTDSKNHEHIAIYDMPEFDNARDLPEDIAASYLTEKVVRTLGRIKVILVIDYESCNAQTYDFDRFMNLILNVAMFLGEAVANREVSLIVTKVPPLGLDEHHRQSVMKFLQQVALKFGEKFHEFKTDANESDPLAQRKFRNIKLSQQVVAMLQNTGGQHIGFFHDPSDPTRSGLEWPLLSSEIHKGDLQNLQEKIVPATDYIGTEGVVFGSLISDKTVISIVAIGERVSKVITSEMRQVGEAAQEVYRKKVKRSTDIRILSEELKIHASELSKGLDDLLNSKKASDYLRKVIVVLDRVNIDVPVKHYYAIKTQSDYLNWLQHLSTSLPAVSTTQWFEPLREVSELVSQYQRWYDFLINLYNELASYKIQLNRKNYNVKQVDRWGQANQTPGIHITRSNYKQFMNVLQRKTNLGGIPSDVDAPKLELLDGLNQVLNATLKEESQFKCEQGNTLIATGVFVTLSQVLAQKSLCKKLQTIKIFGGNTVFVDTNANFKGENLNLFLLAPTWYVYNRAELQLSGKDGESISPIRAGSYFKSLLPSQDGEVGKPGLPGKPSGNFIGVVHSVVNSNNLKISVSGGNGGPGQHGGLGTNGLDVKRIDTKQYRLKDTWNQNWPDSTMHDYINKWKSNEGYTTKVIDKKVCYYWRGCWYIFMVYPAITGGRGGNGGNGGIGGYGGKKGQALYMATGSSKPVVQIANKDGSVGRGGDGGSGAYGGYHGEEYTFKTTVTFPKFYKVQTWWGLTSSRSRGYATNGVSGTASGNTQGRVEADDVLTIDPSLSLNEYKNYLRVKNNNAVHSGLTTMFLEEIYLSNDVMSVYTTLGFVDELTKLEQQFATLNKELDFLPHYKAYTERLDIFSANLFKLKGREKSTEERMVLFRLYTAAYTKMITLEENDSILVIELPKYLSKVKSNIKEISDIKQDEVKFSETEKYVEGIQEKINEIDKLSKTDVITNVDSVFAKISKSIEDLVDEVKKLKASAKTEAELLQKKKSELQNQLIIKRVLGSLSIVGTLVGFLGPYGKAAQVGIDGGSAIAEHFLVKEPADVDKVKLPAGIDSLLEKAEKETKSVKDGKTESLESQFKQVLSKFEGLDDVLSNIKDKVMEVYDEWKEEKKKAKECSDEEDDKKDNKKDDKKGDKKDDKKDKKDCKKDGKTKEKNDGKVDSKKVDEIQDKLEEAVKDGEKKEKAKGTWDKISEKGKKALEVAKKIITVGKACHKEYNAYKEDMSKIEQVADEIDQAYDKFLNLRKFENEIYNQAGPLLRTMRANVDNIASGLTGQSKAQLKIAQWNLQGTLQEIKSKMAKVVKGFEVEEQLGDNFTRLEQVMTLLISLYDQLQSYEEQKALGQFISAINGDKSRVGTVSDKNLQKTMYEMERTIRTNLVIREYQLAFTSMKLAVFPFAKRYLANFALPETKDLNKLVDGISTQIDSFTALDQEYRTTIRSGVDSHTIHQIYTENVPLFDWDGALYRDELTDLLSGKKVYLKSDISEKIDHNAIKVRQLELNFVPRKNGSAVAEAKIKEIINKFKYIFVHSGISQYRCGERVYTIQHPPQIIEQSFERKGNELITCNDVCRKLKSADVLISPYTFWEIHLEDLGNSKSTDFSLPKQLIGLVDLQLLGVGQFLDTKSKVCTSEIDLLNKYYQPDNSEGDLFKEYRESIQERSKLSKLRDELELQGSDHYFSEESFTYESGLNLNDTEDNQIPPEVVLAPEMLPNLPHNATGIEGGNYDCDPSTCGKDHADEFIDFTRVALANASDREEFLRQNPDSADVLYQILNTLPNAPTTASIAPSRRRRSLKHPPDTDDDELIVASSSASKSNSPINTFVNAVLLQLTVIELAGYFDNAKNFISSFFTSSSTQSEKYQDRIVNGQSANDFKDFKEFNMNAAEWFDVADNTLLLAPIFIHYWQRFIGGQQSRRKISPRVCRAGDNPELIALNARVNAAIKVGDELYGSYPKYDHLVDMKENLDDEGIYANWSLENNMNNVAFGNNYMRKNYVSNSNNGIMKLGN